MVLMSRYKRATRTRSHRAAPIALALLSVFEPSWQIART